MNKLILLYLFIFGSLTQAHAQELKVTVSGQGPKIILIPGLASSGEVWDETVAQLSKNYECHVLTLPGFGTNPAVEMPSGFLTTMEKLITDYILAQKEKVTLIGHSLGGFLSLRLSRSLPDPIQKSIIVDSFPFYSAAFNPAATEENMVGMASQMKQLMLSQSSEQYRAQQQASMPMMTINPEKLPIAVEWSMQSDRATTAEALYELMTTDFRDELAEVKEKYGDERRSAIEYAGGDVSIEDLIADENVVITISHAGYIKRTNLSEYKTQNRGGVGQKSAGTRDQDFLEHLFVATNHQYLLFFTQKGKCFWMRVYEIPEGTKASKGRAIQNIVNIESDDKVKAFICTQDLKDQDYINSHYVIMVTKQGQVKKTSLEQYSRPRQNGINAITIKEDDELIGAKLTTGNSQVLVAVKSGKLVRFEEEKTRPMGRTASGVRGITLADEKDEVIGMVSIDKDHVADSQILVVTENGYGKRTKVVDEDGEDVYRITNRGGKGVKTLNITEKTGQLISINDVTDEDDLMIINKSGLTIRMKVSDLRVMGRATQGVRLINIKGSDSIAAVTKVLREDEDEIIEEDIQDIDTGTDVDSDTETNQDE